MTDEILDLSKHPETFMDTPAIAPPSPDWYLRKAMMQIGSQLMMAAVLQDLEPKRVAAECSLSEDQLHDIFLGKNVDVGVKTMIAVCSRLGRPLTLSLSNLPKPMTQVPLAPVTPEAPANA